MRQWLPLQQQLDEEAPQSLPPAFRAQGSTNDHGPDSSVSQDILQVKRRGLSYREDLSAKLYAWTLGFWMLRVRAWLSWSYSRPRYTYTEARSAGCLIFVRMGEQREAIVSKQSSRKSD